MKKLFLLLLPVLMSIYSYAQDIIVTKDAKKINAKIEEVASVEIKYKKADFLNGPTFVMPTSDILCIIFENDKVMVFEDKKLKDPKPEINLTREELEKYDAVPRKLVAKSGDYSMLYDKKALVYFDVNFDDAYIVKFTHYDAGVDSWSFSLAGHSSELNFHSIDLSEIIKTFNENPIFPKKCYLVSYSDSTKVKGKLDRFSNFYKMELKVRFLDVGNSGVYKGTNTRGEAGGAVIDGELIITDLSTNKEVGRILVDRVSGKSTPFLNTRLENAISTMLMPELFHVKKK